MKSGSEAKSVDTTPTIEFDFKARFAETKAAAKVCDALLVFTRDSIFSVLPNSYTETPKGRPSMVCCKLELLWADFHSCCPLCVLPN